MKTPEEIQAEARKMAAKKFSDEMLAVFRKRLFGDLPEKEWFQHRSTVLKAIMEPARDLQARGAALPGSRYRDILVEIIKGIEAHGRLDRIHHRSVYLLHCVQQHMRKHGDNYYEEGKTPRGASLMVGSALSALSPRRQAHDLTASLAAGAAVIQTPGGKRKGTGAAGATQGELF